MTTKQVTGKIQRGKLCSCSPMQQRFEGYTSVAMAEWFPEGLTEMLAEHFGHQHEGSYFFKAAPRTVYSFLAEFEADTALLLLSYGFKTVADARDFLHYSGYGYMGSDENADTAWLACAHGVAVDNYLDIYDSRKHSLGENRYMEDALIFLTGFTSDKYFGGMASLISADEVRLSHVEEIGYDVITHCVDSEHLTKALKDLRNYEEMRKVGTQFEGPGYTTEDVRNLLLKCGERQAMLRRLKFMDLFGFKTAFNAVHLGYLSSLIGRSGFGYNAELFTYADELFGVMKKLSDKNIGDILTADVVAPLHEAKVPSEFAAEKLLAGEPIKRIVALSAGVHTSITEGWL